MIILYFFCFFLMLHKLRTCLSVRTCYRQLEHQPVLSYREACSLLVCTIVRDCTDSSAFIAYQFSQNTAEFTKLFCTSYFSCFFCCFFFRNTDLHDTNLPSCTATLFVRLSDPIARMLKSVGIVT